jgi:tape measure domain-containing protein
MAIRKTGVRLEAEGAAGFMGAMTSANQAVESFGREGRRSADSYNASMGGVSIATIAMGNIVAMVFQTAVGHLVQFTTQAVGAAARLQILEISLESLAAREIIAAGATDDMTKALEMAEPAAANLFDQIREISMISPFEYEDIVAIFQLNMAFGQTSEMALKLTKAITDMAAASGRGAEMLQRVAYNFSQMNMVGQITMRDVRDLAMAGVDLAAVFKDQLAMSIDEVNEALKRGDMTMKDVSEAFVRYADQNFGGAADRMSKTFQGLTSSFQDLMFFVSTDLVGPALDVITESLGGMLDKATAFVDSGVLKDAGNAVGVFLDVIMSSSKEAPKVTGKALEEMRLQFQDAAINAATWGANIMVSFAEGLIFGFSAVVKAIQWIGHALFSWLAPGSAPKVAPDLPDWGKSALEMWLHGMTRADFSGLKAIQGPLKAALNALVSAGAMGTAQMGKLYVGFSKDIIKALSTGIVDENLFTRIAKSIGPFGKEIAELTKLQIELAIATERIEKAEKAIMKGRKKAGKAVYEYNKLLKEGAGKAVLDAKLAEVRAAEVGIDSAVKEREAASENIDDLQEKAGLQKSIVETLIDLYREQNKMEPGGAGAGAGGGMKPPDLAMPDMPNLDNQLDEIGDQFKAKIREIFAKMKKDIQDEFNKSALGEFWGNLRQLMGMDEEVDLSPKLRFGLGVGMDEKLIAPKEGRIENFMQDVFGLDEGQAARITEIFGQISDAFGKIFTPEVVGTMAKIAGAITAIAITVGVLNVVMAIAGAILGLVFSPLGLILIAITAIIVAWTLWGDSIKAWFDNVSAWFASDPIGPAIEGWLQGVGPTIEGWVKESGEWFEGWKEDTSETFTNWKEETLSGMADWVSEAGTTLEGWYKTGKEAWDTFWEGFGETIETVAEFIIETILSIVEAIIGPEALGDVLDWLTNEVLAPLEAGWKLVNYGRISASIGGRAEKGWPGVPEFGNR